MLQIVHPICCGIDVHIKFVVASIGTTNQSGVTEYQTKQFSTFTVNLRRKKSDKKDSIWLYDLHKHGLVHRFSAYP